MSIWQIQDYHREQPLQDIYFNEKGEIFKDLPNVFGIPDDVLVVDYDSDCKDHDDTNILQTCREVNLKTKQRKMAFQMHISTILREVIAKHG